MILVTGGTGMVGAHLLFDLVSAGLSVRALTRTTAACEKTHTIFSCYSAEADTLFKKIEWVTGDVEDYHSLISALEGVELVYHTAAFVSFDPRHKKKIFSTNIYGTANVVNACLEKKVKKLCHVSSVAALGKSPDGSAVDENIKWLPADKHSPYSISKYFSETEVWRGAEEGLPVVIVNPSVILGPGDWQNGSCSILTIVDEGLSFYTTGITGYVDVRDVTKAMIQLMNSDISNERFLLNAENICYKDIFLSIAGKLGKKQKFREAKQWMMALAWRFEYLKYLITRIPPRVTKDIASAGLSRTFYSSSKFKKLLNFDFTPIDESIANMARCYRR